VFSARDACRAGELWRVFQEAAIEASTRAGWPPERYRETKSAFVVSEMMVRHHREPWYGEAIEARTWVSQMRRGTISVREIRLSAKEGAIADATQKWVYVDASLRPLRGGPGLTEAFPEHDEGPSVAVPKIAEQTPGATHEHAFRPWHTWMDPLDHVNHTSYLDWCDETVAQRMHHAGIWPALLKPVAERVRFQSAASVDDEIVVRTTRTGCLESGDVVFDHSITTRGGRACAQATTVRTLADGNPDRLAAAFDP
jgi:acyl-CoA thioesterase FadM